MYFWLLLSSHMSTQSSQQKKNDGVRKRGRGYKKKRGGIRKGLGDWFMGRGIRIASLKTTIIIKEIGIK